VSAQAILGATSGAPVGALAASERMQRLQTLIAQVEQGPAGFAAALQAAQTPSTAAGQTSLASSTATTGPYPGLEQSTGQPTAASPSLSAASTPTTLDAAVVSPAESSGGTVSQYDSLIAQAAARNGVDPAVLHGLIQQESGFDPNATSGAGALGLTQLMPSTATSLGVTEPLNPAQSIEGGARYLGQMLRQFGGNTADALAAYNAGPGAVQQYGGVPPYTETQQYVTKVLANAAAYRGATGGASTAAATASSIGPGTIA
jgi:soluble lytic murein transglycosylase-like protein